MLVFHSSAEGGSNDVHKKKTRTICLHKNQDRRGTDVQSSSAKIKPGFKFFLFSFFFVTIYKTRVPPPSGGLKLHPKLTGCQNNIDGIKTRKKRKKRKTARPQRPQATKEAGLTAKTIFAKALRAKSPFVVTQGPTLGFHSLPRREDAMMLSITSRYKIHTRPKPPFSLPVVLRGLLPWLRLKDDFDLSHPNPCAHTHASR